MIGLKTAILQELHDAEGDGALAGMRAGSGDVKSFAHSEFGAAE